ncbi:MAG: methyltransferase domain-containing protein [Acidobacteriota bacterium]
MFDKLGEINSRPTPFQFYTAEELWTNEHTSEMMLKFHLNESIDVSSRNGEFINRSIKWMVSHFGIGVNTGIADFGCGPGLYTTRFAERGARVTGIDFSGRSINYAKKIAAENGLNINYVNQNYLNFKSETRFDLITMIFCDFCALNPTQRKTLLAGFHNLLKPGGSVLLDVHSLNAFNKRDEIVTYEYNQLDHFWSPENYYGFLNTFKYDREKVTLDKYTIIEEKRTRVVYNWLQYFSQDSLRKEFEENGFEAAEFYSDVAGSAFSPDSPDMAIVARKAENI